MTESAKNLKRDAVKIIDAMQADLLAASHEIHAAPELAFEEKKAAANLSGRAERAGLDVQRGVFGLETAYAASFGRAGGVEVAILSEYDALPGIGHACGHNIIAAAGLGAALALARLEDRLPGRVRYLGTPAEERGGGKEIMAGAGAFEGTAAALMVHPAGLDLAAVGALCVSEVEIVYEGRSAHAAAMPHRGINALDGLITAYQAIAQLRQHIRPSERIHGIITEGGVVPNVVPDRAAACFFVRAATAPRLADLRARVEGCFRAGAEASGSQLRINWSPVDYLDLKNNAALTGAYEANARAIGRAFFPPEQLPANAVISTDMGNVSHRVPSIHPMIAAAPANVVIHHPDFARHAASPSGDKAALDGAKALAMTALDFMCDPALRQSAREEFAQTQAASDLAVASARRGAGCC